MLRFSLRPKSLLPYAILSFLFLAACSQNNTAADTVIRRESTQVKVENKRKEPKTLTENNAQDFLKEYAAEHKETIVEVSTPKGSIKIRLYKNTPLHRANFLYLTKKKYFDDTWFYRVSEGHVIQAGNTDAVETVRKRKKIGEYKIPAEMVETNYHKYGAVAVARSYFQNPEKLSDPYEFYIVLGKSYTRRELELLAEKHEMTFSDAQLDFYSKNTGSPHLDGQHTVFGEVVAGMDVVEAISKVQVDEGEWPVVNLPIKVKVLK
ncbi:peptidylprolyl isomerase [Owenweeksia hongkongensis]|uniref:peptidylprolyl isomerase n=1 Tax=Owenweeksia hongkongensis TaxID=253245 RepID=UPI003A94B4C6